MVMRKGSGSPDERRLATNFDAPPAPRADAGEALAQAAQERILILDGAMGTQIQDLSLGEEHFRGERFIGCECHLKGNNDLLTSQPQAIEDIHFAYAIAAQPFWRPTPFLRPGSRRPTTACRSGVHTSTAMARLARRAAPEKERSGSTASGALSPARSTRPTAPRLDLAEGIRNPGYRAVTFDMLREAYSEQIGGLIDGSRSHPD